MFIAIDKPAPLPISGSLLPIVLIAGLCLLLLALLRRLARRKDRPIPLANYEPREFLSPAELLFFQTLLRVTAGTFHVCCKVRLGDLLQPIENDLAARNRVNQKHVDFVLCDLATMTPMRIVELDDRSHATRGHRDAFIDAALARAGLSIVRIRAAAFYEPAAVARALGIPAPGRMKRR